MKDDLTVASLHIHPIKSLGGFSVSEARITPQGFEHDRRWMLVDGNGVFITQREQPTMALLHCSPRSQGFRVTDTRDEEQIDLPWMIDGGESGRVQIWSDQVDIILAPLEVSAWFSEKLNITCALCFMPDHSHRPINPAYANGITALNDGYPYLIISQASVDDLNARIRSSSDLPMDRFRPSIVIADGEPYQEDGWKEIAIGDTRFALVKPCERCAITTTDQRTGERGKEPLRTLATYRRRGNGVDFGMNAVAISGDVVRVGDQVRIA